MTTLPATEQKTRPVPLVGKLFFGFIALSGLALFLFGARELVRAWHSESWPQAEATIISSHVDTSQSRSKHGSTTMCSPKIDYQFEVDGETYTGSRVEFGSTGSSDCGHERGLVQRHPEGSQALISYKPDDPELCVLEPGMNTSVWIIPAGGTIFFLVSLFFYLFMRSGWLRTPTPSMNAPRTDP